MRNEKGMTLIELLVCMLIVAVLFLIALPVYSGYTGMARETVAVANERTLRQVAQLYLLDGGSDTVWAPDAGDTSRATVSGPHEAWYEYLDKWPENPLGGVYVVEIEDGEITVWTRGAGE